MSDALAALDVAARLAADAELSRRVVLADDEPAIRTALGRFLVRRGFEVAEAENGDAALRLVAQGGVACLVSDVRMPGMSGHELVQRAIALDPDLAVVMLTALTDARTATAALTAGAFDFLTKPVELQALLSAVDAALLRRQRNVRQRHLERLVREAVTRRTAELEREQAALRALTLASAESLVNAMEAKDPYLRGHSGRVARLAARIAHVLGHPPEMVARVRTAGLLHDIGKIGIREAVLHKRGPLSPEEFRHVQEHVALGVQILAPLVPLQDAVAYIADHHEHWDGSGYPAGARGETITDGGRILAAADQFDALTSVRPYRAAMPPSQALAYLATQRGRLLAPEAHDALVAVVRRRMATGDGDGDGAEPSVPMPTRPLDAAAEAM